MARYNIAILLMFLLVFSSLLPAQPAEVVESYLTALQDGRYNEAAGYWDDRVIDQARRLGIFYDSIPVKYDCASPVAEMVDELQNGAVTFTAKEKSMKGDIAEVSAVFRTEFGSITHAYALEREDSLWRITSPVLMHSEGWPADTTGFAVVFRGHDSVVNSFALAAMDSFIENTAMMLGIDSDKMDQLRSAKVLNFVCDKDEIVSLTGYDTQGMTSLPLDAVISRHLPHFHEITHELVNYRMARLPLYTLPFMQEGIASWIGGRWGRSPRVIRYAGNIIFDYELIEPEVLLTFNGFNKEGGGADLTYPAAALLAGYLFESLGPDRFFELYRTLSGSSQAVSEMHRGFVISTLEQSTGMSWEELLSEFHAFRSSYRESGLTAGVSGDIEHAGETFDFGARAVRKLALSDRVEYVCELPENRSWSVLLFDTGEKAEDSYRSRLFAEHIPHETYTGQRYGLRFGPEEVGLYDYWTNTLLANYVSSLAPSPDYENKNDNTISFAVPKGIVDLSDCRPVYLLTEKPSPK